MKFRTIRPNLRMLTTFLTFLFHRILRHNSSSEFSIFNSIVSRFYHDISFKVCQYHIHVRLTAWRDVEDDDARLRI